MVPNLNNAQLEAIAQDWLQKYGKYDGRMLRLEHSLEIAGYRIEPRPGLAEIAEAFIPAKSHYIFVDEAQYMSESLRWPNYCKVALRCRIISHRRSKEAGKN